MGIPRKIIEFSDNHFEVEYEFDNFKHPISTVNLALEEIEYELISHEDFYFHQVYLGMFECEDDPEGRGKDVMCAHRAVFYRNGWRKHPIHGMITITKVTGEENVSRRP